ncbi:MAG: tetratricopeptide repeat protein [Krumholzibacteria bacterium]|nr:tetratricopeptide repeat protein [Candidatus Krumholzibacteria bacterium]
MHLTRQNYSVRRSLGALALLAGLLTAGGAAAECLPGQMQEADLAYQSAAEFLTQQSWEQAIARLQSIVTVCPEHVPANRGLGTAYLGKGEAALAAGSEAEAGKDFTAAADWFGKVIAARGAEVEAGDYANLAKAYAKQKKYKEARAEYMKAEMLAPEDCGVLFNLAVLHSAAGYHTQAVDVFEHIIALDECERAHARALTQIASAAGKAAEQQKKAGNSQQAAYYQDLSNQYGGQAGGSTAMDIVRGKMKAGDYTGAVTLLRELLGKNPDQPNATLTLARALDSAGREAESVDAYRDYLKLKPNDTTEWGTMLQVMVESGQAVAAKSEAAAAYAEHSSKGRQALAPILYSWGLALEQTEEFATARARFEECAASGHARFAASARTQVQRMDDLMQLQAAQKKKAAQQGG